MMSPKTRSDSVAVGMIRLAFYVLALLLAFSTALQADDDDEEESLDMALEDVLDAAGFTGEIESTLTSRLGRPLDERLVDLGRLLFFDEIMSLRDDNACAGCHTPAFGFGDPQSIAYGVRNNRIVGPGRRGERNERKAPILTNVGFFPRLMLNGRFIANSGDPFDNSQGFGFPPPNDSRFLPNDPLVPNLLTAQAFLPVPSLVEMAGFQGTAGTLGPRFEQFDDGVGTPIPPADASGSNQGPILDLVVERLNDNSSYRKKFKKIFGNGDIIYEWVGQAMAEFQISIIAANAPIDRFARGEHDAMTAGQKRGALLFFGEARCSQCHSTGISEMFSDFENRSVGVPQIHPQFGAGLSNIIFDGPGEDEDFGQERISGDAADRYHFRTSPIRNVALQPAFFHNGAYTRLEDAVRQHLDVTIALDYDPAAAGVAPDLQNEGPIAPVLAQVDPIVATPVVLDDDELEDLVEFVRDGLLDPKSLPKELCNAVPDSVPSGRPLPEFEGCERVNVCLRISRFERTITVPRKSVRFLRKFVTPGSCEFQ